MWQWRVHGAALDDGRVIDEALLRAFTDDVVEDLRKTRPDYVKIDDAKALFLDLIMDDHLEEFLTTPAYAKVVQYEQEGRL